jgi:GH25 family lysozyme M1 (1,4-beta-N-acetylmuramidase)
MFKTVILVSLVLICAFASEGVDFSRFQGAPAQSVFNCFKQNGKSFLIMQIWSGGYGINPNFVSNYQKAKAAGISYIDAYAFICNNCAGNTPDNICSKIKSTLPSGFSGQVWLDLEQCEACWTNTDEVRMKFVQGVASQCHADGLKLGIYSGMGSWAGVFGTSSYDAGSLKSYPLWYSHYDGVTSFNDWASVKFGGFSKPAMKQYKGSTSFCGTTVDFSAY